MLLDHYPSQKDVNISGIIEIEQKIINFVPHILNLQLLG